MPKSKGLRRAGAWGWPALAAVFAAALGIRLLYLWQIHDAPFFALRLGDAERYHAWARQIAAGDWLGQGAFYQAPLYPYFLGVVYAVAGDGVVTVRVIHALLGAAACVFLAAAGTRVFGRWGILAGVLLALHPPAIFLDGLLEKSALVTFLTAALLAALAAPLESMKTRQWATAGVVLGLLALTRENALILAAPVLLCIAMGRAPRRGAQAAVFLAGCLAVLLPVAIRNRVAGGEFHLTTAQFGPNFYIGNHAGASGSYEGLVTGHGNAEDEREDAVRLAERAAGRKLNAGEVSRYWSGRALDYMRRQPLDWAALTARKLAGTWNAAEVSDTESQEVYAERSWLLRVLRPFDFGVLFGLAAMGAALAAGEWRRLRLFYMLACAYALSVAAFYVFARYRFPLAVMLMLPAAGGRLALRGASRRSLAVAAAAGVAAIAFAHLPLYDARTSRATHYAGIAGGLSKDAKELDVAMSYYQRALDADPRFAAAQFGMGTMLARTGRPAEAIPYYRAALALWPDYEEAHYNLGMALAAAGGPAAAAEEFGKALRIRPDDADAYFALGKLLLGEDPGRAVEVYRQGLALHPRDVAGLVGLGVALTQTGRPERAVEQYQAALEIDPRDAAAHNNLGWTLATQGRIAEAVPHFERALELQPDYANARRNLEQARRMLDRR